MVRILGTAGLVVAASAVLAFSLPEADGCASLPPRDYSAIHIATESAIIVWDPVKKVQHFIRRAAFDTKAPDFGFLVPTPTLPQLPLAEVGNGAFRSMENWILPARVERTRWKYDPMLCIFGCGKMSMKGGREPASAVRVLHEQKVGGYEAKVLEADDAEALAQWIKAHGYSADPELYEWLRPYVASKWKITAFKISQDPKTGQLATTKAVRMSFQTERPFFPYREPEVKQAKRDDNGKDIERRPRGSRLLRVYFVAGGRMEGKLGAGAWYAAVPWSDVLSDERRLQLAAETGVPVSDIPAKAWLTTFEDDASPRPGKDEVYFDPATEQTPIRPPDFVKFNYIWIPLDVVLLGLFIASGVAFRLMRRKRSAAASA